MTPEDHLVEAVVLRDARMHTSAQTEALMAIAGFLNQMHVCDHGNRGWCPYCARTIHDGGRL